MKRRGSEADSANMAHMSVFCVCVEIMEAMCLGPRDEMTVSGETKAKSPKICVFYDVLVWLIKIYLLRRWKMKNISFYNECYLCF
jgi:hypothetical protein